MYCNDPKAWEYTKVTADGVVCEGPCYVKRFDVFGNAANGTSEVYDGQGTGGQEKYVLQCNANLNESVEFAIPLYFSRGIYLDMDSKHTWVRVQFQRIEPGS